jgi:hypothetical protein
MNHEAMSSAMLQRVLRSKEGCPYCNACDDGICMASLSSLSLDAQKVDQLCKTENYQDCPLFLSKVLRT